MALLNFSSLVTSTDVIELKKLYRNQSKIKLKMFTRTRKKLASRIKKRFEKNYKSNAQEK